MTDRPFASEHLEAPADPRAFHEFSLAEGFGDGMPLLPPTEDAVGALLDATPLASDHVLGTLAPAMVEATVEKVAVNAAMTGVTPAAFGYVIAALEAILAPPFNWSALAATTSSVTANIVVNGPGRFAHGFDMEAGCMGGAAGRGSMTVGRAVQLCLRNIGGQKVGVTSKSVFGQPARVTGLSFAEWEEESPWPSLAERLGYAAADEVVTVHGGKGTFPFADIHNDDARDLLTMVAKTLAFPLANMYLGGSAGHGETFVAFNPVWAQRFGAAFPDVADLQAFVQEHAWQPVDLWPADNRRILEERGRIDAQGRVHLAARPDQWVPIVCGGRGSLHGVALTSWGESSFCHAPVRR
ncbi:MAG: hypothetical protein FJW95_03240 [Actinobacteria bacterium]|nr:hypothetical protein [Actinomycetota bacterium]